MGVNPIINMRRSVCKSLIYIVLSLIFLFIGVKETAASHLVGGDLTYQCLGGNRYKIVLTIRRDCALAFPDALFDDPASIGIFDQNYKLITDLAANGQILIPLNNDDTLNQVLINKCTVTTGDVCVHETKYEFTINLPIRSGGYNFVYQRCCRNISLTNTSDPLNTGMTLIAHLSERSMQLCNSSPVFKQWPAIYICNDQDIQFDHSARDADGDSLVYRLVTPYAGATREIPRPQPPNPGPYADINWSSGVYSVNNMLGSLDGEKNLSINQNNGLLSGTPALVGQFVVGVEVDEYRNGELIGTIRRDFQYNVRNCAQDILAQMDSPGGLCGGERTITFKNTSLNAPFIQWFFDYPNNLSATSKEANPTYTYPAEGTYVVMLIAGVQGACMDTLKREIHVFDEPLNMDLDYEPLSCSNENLLIKLVDLSSDPNGTINKWNWTISFGSTLIVKEEQSPEIIVPHNLPITVTLTVESTSGCVETITKVLTPKFIKDDISVENIIVCPGDTTVIDPIRGTLPPLVNIQWVPGQPNLIGELNSRTIRFVSSTLGSVIVFFDINNGSGCGFRDSVRIDILYRPALAFSIDNVCGTNQVKITNTTSDATNFSWVIESKDTSIGPKSFDYLFASGGDKLIVLKTTDGCAPSLRQSIYLFDSTSIFSKLNRNARGCPGDVIELNPGGDPDLIYSWSPIELFSDPHATNPTLTVGPTTVKVMVNITHRNNPDCSLMASLNIVNIIEEILKDLKDTIFVCPEIPIVLNPNGDPKLTYEWSPATLFSNPRSPSPTLTTDNDIQVKVKITDPNNVNCFAEKTINVLIGVNAVIDAIPDTIETCPGREITINSGGDPSYKYEWFPTEIFSNPNVVSPRITVDTHTIISVKVTDTINGNCIATKDILLWIPVLDALNKLPDSLLSCAGISTNLNPLGSTRFTYLWSPPDNLDDPTSPNPTAKISESTAFSVTITDLATNCQAIGSVRVIIIGDILNKLPDSIFACPGIAITLNAGGRTDLIYEWNPAILFSNPRIPSPTLTTDDDVEITVKITDPNNTSCFIEKTIRIIIGVDAVIDGIPDTIETCPGREITINPGGSPLYEYEWSPAEIFSNPNAVSPKITVDTHTVISVKVTDTINGNCSASKEILLWIPVLDEINKLPDSLISCFGAPVNLNPQGNSRFTYQWSPADKLDNPSGVNPTATVSVTTTFSVTISDAVTDCQLIGSVKVIVPPSFELVTNINDTTLCATDSIHLMAEVRGGINVKLEWKNPQGEVISTENEIDLKPNGSGNYTVTATDAYGCSKSQSFMIIRGTLDISIELKPDGVICAGDEINLSVINNRPDQTLTYSWKSDPSITSRLNGSSITATPLDTVTYEVVVSNAEGCSKTLTYTVNVVPFNVEVVATSNPYTIDLGKTSQLNVTTGSGYTYKWDPAITLDKDNVPNPVAKPTETTIYTATVTSPEGCSGSDTTIVNIIIPECAEPFLFIPNAFTPNGDGHNDVLFVRGNTIDEMELIIYNRWGQQVFRSTSQSFGWDGRFNGSLATPDVYGYYLTILCTGGETFTKKGNITLLR